MYLRCLVECLAHCRCKRVFIRLDLCSWQILLPQIGIILQFVGKRSYTQRHYTFAVYSVENSETHWQWGSRQCRSSSTSHPPFLTVGGVHGCPWHSSRGTGFLWIWKASFLPATANKDLHPLLGRIHPNNPCTFIKGMFTNILVLDSCSLPADDILMGGSEEGEMFRGECRKLDQIRDPQTKLLSFQWPRKPLSPQSPTSHLTELEGHAGSLSLEESDFPTSTLGFS